MTTRHTPIAPLPVLAAAALRPLPLRPLQIFLSAVMRRIVQKHPRMFERLGSYAGKRYGLAPVDLPFAFLLDTTPNASRIVVLRVLPERLDARISGPFLALLGMANGAYDGDALFFSRTIVVEGDIEAVLALRNAIDDAGVDVLREAASLLGPLGRFGEAMLCRRGRAHGPSIKVYRHGREGSTWN